MIIKTTFNDNDYITILEDYWEEFWFDNYYNITRIIEDDIERLKLHSELDEILRKVLYDRNVKINELEKFRNIIKESILQYIKETSYEDYEYLKNNLKVNFRLSITDKDENGESLYYFLNQKTYIEM